MKRLHLIVFALLACSSTTAAQSSTAKELIQLENRFNDALVQADIAVIEEIETDGLIFTDATGTVTSKADEIRSLKSGEVKFASIEMTDTRVQDFGNTAVVTGKLVEKAQYKDTDISGNYRFTDVWEKRDGKWQHVAGQETLVPGTPISLTGTWRVVEFADLDKDGKWVYLFGEHPKGYFVYDATGHVHIQIMKVPPLTPFPEANSDDGKPPTPEHALAAYNSYVAYFGTYTVDAGKLVITHHVEGSLSPDYTDTDQPRPFRLEGDRLEIGDGKTWRRVLERVR